LQRKVLAVLRVFFHEWVAGYQTRDKRSGRRVR